MSSRFGFLGKLNFLQDVASYCVSSIHPSIIHNMGKYITMQKAFFYSSCEGMEGDYLEFGVYTGSSFTHAMRCHKKTRCFQEGGRETRFFGFDSFEGFGELDKQDHHPFFINTNFKTDYEQVNKRVLRAATGLEAQLFKGFFSETLSCGPAFLGITKAKIIMMDCDTYVAASEAFVFCKDIVQDGTIIIVDDRVAYKGSRSKGVTKAFREFLSATNVEARVFCSYGAGATAYIIVGCV